MHQVWGVHIYDYNERRTCREASAAGQTCGARLTKVGDFRWRHECSGLMYDPTRTVFTALVHGAWYSSFSLDALNQFADSRMPLASATPAETEHGAIVIQLDEHRAVA